MPDREGREPQDRDLEADKIQMEYFKQMGTYSLAGAVLIATLYGVLGTDRFNAVLIISLVGAVTFFGITLVASGVGLYAIAHTRGDEFRGNLAPRINRLDPLQDFDPTNLIALLRIVALNMFVSGAGGFLIAVVGMMIELARNAP